MQTNEDLTCKPAQKPAVLSDRVCHNESKASCSETMVALRNGWVAGLWPHTLLTADLTLPYLTLPYLTLPYLKLTNRQVYVDYLT